MATIVQFSSRARIAGSTPKSTKAATARKPTGKIPAATISELEYLLDIRPAGFEVIDRLISDTYRARQEVHDERFTDTVG